MRISCNGQQALLAGDYTKLVSYCSLESTYVCKCPLRECSSFMFRHARLWKPFHSCNGSMCCVLAETAYQSNTRVYQGGVFGVNHRRQGWRGAYSFNLSLSHQLQCVSWSPSFNLCLGTKLQFVPWPQSHATSTASAFSFSWVPVGLTNC